MITLGSADFFSSSVSPKQFKRKVESNGLPVQKMRAPHTLCHDVGPQGVCGKILLQVVLRQFSGMRQKYFRQFRIV